MLTNSLHIYHTASEMSEHMHYLRCIFVGYDCQAGRGGSEGSELGPYTFPMVSGSDLMDIWDGTQTLKTCYLVLL